MTSCKLEVVITLLICEDMVENTQSNSELNEMNMQPIEERSQSNLELGRYRNVADLYNSCQLAYYAT